MYRNLKTVAFIPARKNSKGIKNKNLRLIGGKSLVELTILQALESNIFDLIVLSSDSDEILRLVRKYNIASSGTRPDKFSSDESKIIDVVRYDYGLLGFSEYDCLVLLQPTSPLRTSEDIKRTMDLFIDSGHKSVVSVFELDEKLHLLRELDDEGILIKVANIDSNIRRQDATKLLKVNGAIYINKMEDFDRSDFVFNDNKFPYIMSLESSIDIDEISDLYLARKTYRKSRENA